jgi:hypothetical protein
MALRRLWWIIPLLFLSGVLASLHGISPGESILYESTVFVRDAGKPQTLTESFTLTEPQGKYTLIIQNGDPDSDDHRVTSGYVSLNGLVVATNRDLNRQIERIERFVPLQAFNQIEVEIRGKPYSYLSLWIEGEICGSGLAADAGPDQTVALGSTVQLAGRALNTGECTSHEEESDEQDKHHQHKHVKSKEHDYHIQRLSRAQESEESDDEHEYET